ncbi:MAG: hypothetical protein JHC71_11475 [Blastococcus sp.]|nr:hypothetical protein [Blastococcus sp.]
MAIQSERRTGRLTVDLVGWFTAPASSAELTVPLDVNTPEVSEVAAASGSSAGGAQVTLAPGAARVEVGQPIIFGATADIPEGLMGRITAVTVGLDGTQLVTTEPIALTEVFPDGEISVDLDGEDPVTPAGAVLEPTAGGATLTSVSSGVRIGLRFEPPASNECAFENGVIGADFEPILRAKYRFKWKTRYLGIIPVGVTPRVTMLATMGADASLRLEKLGVACDFEIEFGKVIVPIPETPIYITFEFGGRLDVDAMIDPRVEANAHAEFTVGVQDNKPYREGTATAEIPDLENLLGSGRLTAHAQSDVWLDASAKVQGIVGPRFSVGPFIEAVLTDSPTRPWFALDMGLAAEVALEVDLGSLGSLTLVDWDGEIPIARLLDPCVEPFGPGFRGPPCRTTVPELRANGARRSEMAPRIRIISSGAPLSGLGRRYRPVEGAFTWPEASAAATANGLPGCTSAHLATLTSQQEQDAVYAAIGSSAQGKWLGGYQEASAAGSGAGWRWVTGEDWGYAFWQTGEPNDNGEIDEKYLGFGGSTFEPGTWNDFSEERRLGYIVEGEGCGG